MVVTTDDMVSVLQAQYRLLLCHLLCPGLLDYMDQTTHWDYLEEVSGAGSVQILYKPAVCVCVRGRISVSVLRQVRSKSQVKTGRQWLVSRSWPGTSPVQLSRLAASATHDIVTV